MRSATPHARTQQPMRTPGSQGSSELAGQPLWTITVWPVTPHVESSVPMVNGMAPTFKPGFTLYGEALPDASLFQTASYSVWSYYICNSCANRSILYKCMTIC